MWEEGSSHLSAQQSGGCLPHSRRVQDHDGNKASHFSEPSIRFSPETTPFRLIARPTYRLGYFAMSESRAVFSIILRPWLGQNQSDACWTRATTRSVSPPFLPGMGKLAESNFSKCPLELFRTRMRLDFASLGKELI